MPRLASAGRDEGSIVVAMLMLLSLAGLSLVLVASTLSHVSTARRDNAFTKVLPAGDAALQLGLFQANNGQASTLPTSAAPAVTDQGGQVADWYATGQSVPTKPTSYLLTSTTRGLARQLRAEAYQKPRFPVAAFADRSVVLRGGNTADSYNSLNSSTSPTGAGRVGSNGSVTFDGNATANGVDLYNWAAQPNTSRCSGAPCPVAPNYIDERLDFTDAAATQFITAQTAGCSTPAYVSPTSATVLQSGTWCTSSLQLRGNVTVSGPTVIYVAGNVTIEHHLQINYAPGVVPQPSLLQIYMLGSSFDMANHTTVAAAIYAPFATCEGGAQSVVYGSLICGSISNVGGWSFHYDEALGAIGDSQFRLRNYREG